MLSLDGQLLSLPKPHRHNQLFALVAFIGSGDFEDAVQGFTTNYGKFVGRAIAMTIAEASGQLTSDKYELFSEDLW